MSVKIKLNIADLIIQIQSAFPLAELTKNEKFEEYGRIFDNFFFCGKKKARIIIELRFVKRLPKLKSGQNTFISSYYLQKEENWRITPQKDIYIYQCPLRDEESAALINSKFSRAIFYRLPRRDRGKVWKITDVTHNFLQVLMINYLALRKIGFFAHGAGIHDRNGQGLLFCGKSGAGKSTSARIWFKHSRAMVLNDDRVIVRKKRGRFFIYSSPWSGEFGDYFKRALKPAPLKRLFFIYHAKKNIASRIDPACAFKSLFPATFPVFWNKKCLEKIAALCDDAVNQVPSYQLGFVNDKRIIEFTRNIDERTAV